MKKILSGLVLMIMAFAFILSGCGSSVVMPATNASVKGNGGFVVQKGEYIYFANAYTGYATLGAEENPVDSTDAIYGIFRVKTSSFINGSVTYDEDGYPENIEKIVAKVSGFENSGLYIVGDYLYFASPNVHKTNRNENRYNLVTIFSVKLNGSSLRELYTTEDYTNGDWTILDIEGKTYLLTQENTKLIRHELNNGNISNKTVLADNVTDSILIDEPGSDFDKYVYFTTGRSEQETELGFTGNILNKVAISSGTVFSDNNPIGVTITLLTHENSKLFYTTKTSNSATKLYVKNLTGADIKLSDWTDATNLFFFGYENDSMPKDIVFNSQSKLVTQSLDSAALDVLLDSEVTPLFVSGDYVYYSTEENISRINYKERQTTQIVVEAEYQEKMTDFDGRYMYVFSGLEESSIKYLQRVDTYSLDIGNTANLKLIGFVAENDKPDEEE